MELSNDINKDFTIIYFESLLSADNLKWSKIYILPYMTTWNAFFSV